MTELQFAGCLIHRILNLRRQSEKNSTFRTVMLDVLDGLKIHHQTPSAQGRPAFSPVRKQQSQVQDMSNMSLTLE